MGQSSHVVRSAEGVEPAAQYIYIYMYIHIYIYIYLDLQSIIFFRAFWVKAETPRIFGQLGRIPRNDQKIWAIQLVVPALSY